MDESERKKILEEKILKFDPNEVGFLNSGIFGLPFSTQESKIVLVPVPWEATVSYGSGTSRGPKAILDASQQVDLYDLINPNGWKEGIAMQDIPSSIFYNSQHTKEKASKYLNKYAEGEVDLNLQLEINNDCISLNNYVKEVTKKFLDDNKIVGLVGGDHSVPLGYFESLAEKYENFGVLHIDAHADLREAYEGFTYSHASIFFNALKIKNITKLVQVGMRDFCEQEFNLVQDNKDKIFFYTDSEIRRDLFMGKTLKEKYNDIISNLPENVYVSFDIDGLIPYLSPNTGTPVMGGFTIEEIVFLIEEIISSGRKIIGFDLCEVSPGENSEWDANVGARVLYKLCLLALKSHI